MRVSNFLGAKDNDPKQLDFSWEEFASALGPHDFTRTEKLSCPCFSPAEYPPGGVRRAEDVSRVWMFVLDVDGYPDRPDTDPGGVTRETLDALVAHLAGRGLAAVVYSTWSHAEAWLSHGRCKFRVVLPLDEPVEGAAWGSFWHRANALFGRLCDPQCKDPSRLYFGPFAPAGTEALNFYTVLPGQPLSVSEVLELPLPEGVRDSEALVEGEARSRDAEAVALLGAAWPASRRHEAHLALAGGLLSSGFSDARAVDFLCAVAGAQESGNEDRPKRQSVVEHTRAKLTANEKVTGWATLSTIVDGDVVDRVRDLVERPPPVSLDQLSRYAKQLKRSKIDAQAELGDALEKVCQQRVIPELVTLRLAAELGKRFPEYDAKSIAEHFTSSLNAMRSEGEDVTVEQVEARIRQKQDEVRQKRREGKVKKREQEVAVEESKASRIRESYNNGRAHPYTADELAQFAPIVSTGHRWILQKDRAYYFFHHGRYRGPYTEAEATNAALRELAPAASAGVDVYRVTKSGAEFKTLKQLVAEYGTVADDLILDLRAQVTSYDEKTRTIIEAPCPLRPITPTYHADIDEWLWHLVGPDHHDSIKTWMAILPRLDIVRVALFLTGDPSVGKSMFAGGCSRLWTTNGPTPLEVAFGAFNDVLARCPLCFADEQLPKDFRGYTMNPQLRHHIQATERPYKRKYLPNSKLIGVTPTIVAAHDPSILRTPEHVSNNEIEGIMQRYYPIAVRGDAARFLSAMKPTTFERGWVYGDKIAEFVMWLYYNHRHQSEGRFYIDRPDVETTRWLATSSGHRSSVIRWLCSYLGDRKLFEGNANTRMWVRIHNGELLVNINGLLKFWDLYIGNERCPHSGDLATTIGEISQPKRRVQLRDGRGVPTNYRVVVVDNLIAWAKNSDMITPEEIVRQLQKDSIEASLGLVG